MNEQMFKVLLNEESMPHKHYSGLFNTDEGELFYYVWQIYPSKIINIRDCEVY